MTLCLLSKVREKGKEVMQKRKGKEEMRTTRTNQRGENSFRGKEKGGRMKRRLTMQVLIISKP